MYCISFINVSYNADESCQMTETTVIYPLKSPSSGNRGASCSRNFARRSQAGHRTLSLEATAIPPPAPASRRLSNTANRVLCPMLPPGHSLLPASPNSQLGLTLGMDIRKKSSFKLQHFIIISFLN